MYAMTHRFPLLPLLLLPLWLGACTNANNSLTAEQRTQLGRVYLYGASNALETYFHGDISQGGTGGALKGAGNAALDGLDGCLDSALGAGPLAPLVIVVCTPLVVPAAAVKGGRAGSQPLMSEENLAELKNQINQTLQTADLNAALVATVDEQSQKRSALAAHDISHGILPAPENNQTIEQIALQWGYQAVLHIEVTKAGFETDDGRVALIHFSMTAKTKLVDARKNQVLHTGEYRYDSTPQPVNYWLKNDYRLLADEIIKSNRQIANNMLKDIFGGTATQ
ncbi:MAG: hypothetical protein R3E67_05110 [Pseudomonadales bacterium]